MTAVDFLVMPKHYSFAPFFAAVDTAVTGRKTYGVGKKMGGSFGWAVTTYVFSRSKPAGKCERILFTNEPVTTFSPAFATGLKEHMADGRR